MTTSFLTALLLGCPTPMGLRTGDSGTVAGSASAAQPGETCDEGGVFDCDLECWVTEAREYIGDGTCDEGDRGPNFDCIDLDADEGDCDTDEGFGGAIDGGMGGGTNGDGTTGGGTTGGGTSSGGTTGGSTVGGGTMGGGTTGGGTTGGGTTGGGTTGGTTGGDSSVAAEACFLEATLGLVDETGATVLEFPAGHPGYYDCNAICVPGELVLGSEEYGIPAALGNGYCDEDDGSAGPGFFIPDYNCAEWEFDGGDCS